MNTSSLTQMFTRDLTLILPLNSSRLCVIMSCFDPLITEESFPPTLPVETNELEIAATLYSE